MPIRNFVIIAHIDHGKSTLADRMLDLTHTVDPRKMREQMLDGMDLERERGITIKLQPVRMTWQDHILNLIDTPGHVDFQYEVSRSLKAVEGAVLLVDATQGVQAQTLSNLYLAIEAGLEIIPVINKIDLPQADIDGTISELIKIIGGSTRAILKISAKTGEGVETLLNTIIKRIPPPIASDSKSLQALIFDSIYDEYKGVIAYVRVMSGSVTARQKIAFLGADAQDRVIETGIFSPQLVVRENLSAGEIGYIATGLKDVRQARVGDTITAQEERMSVKALPGFTIPQPKVFAGVYPISGDQFAALRDAIGELMLNDASLSVTEQRNQALGQGYQCGFLGVLHLEIVQERLRREHNVDIIVTTPSVVFKVKTTDGNASEITTPIQFPDPSQIESIEEQLAEVVIITPTEFTGEIYEIMQEREGLSVSQEALDNKRMKYTFNMPLRELVIDLHDQIKSVTAGFGSMSYELKRWQAADVVKLSILVNHEPVPALSMIVARNKAESTGRRVVKKLSEVLPKQQFTVPLQAAVGGSIIARESLKALRKDVTSGLYGGDVTRKRKLLEKQKKGKKRLAAKGSVEIPPQAYLAVLKRD